MVTRVEARDGIAWVTFERPERHNSIDLTAIRELHAACSKAIQDPATRCLVLTGAADSFCSGADLKDVASHDDPKEWILGATAELHPLLLLLHEGPKPTLTAINGAAAGGGLGLALAGDVRIAADTAKFRSAYARIGLTPDGGSTYFVTRQGGLTAAQRLFFLEETLDAAEAQRLGLVHRVVPRGELDNVAHETARLLASWSGPSYAVTKRLLSKAGRETAERQMDDERREIADAGLRPDGREGIAAFLAKRKPCFA